MSALIKLSAGRNKGFLGITPHAGVEMYAGPGFAVSLVGCSVSSVNASVYKVKLGTIQPQKYEALLSVSQDVHEIGVVSGPSVYAPGEEVELTLYIRPHKKVDDTATLEELLSKLPCIARLYLID